MASWDVLFLPAAFIAGAVLLCWGGSAGSGYFFVTGTALHCSPDFSLLLFEMTQLVVAELFCGFSLLLCMNDGFFFLDFSLLCVNEGKTKSWGLLS